MKDYNYNSVLGEEIENSKIKSFTFKDYLKALVVTSVIGLAFLGILKLLEIGFVVAVPFVGGFVLVSGGSVIVSNYQNRQKRQKAKESLSSLENDLKFDDINLKIENLQKSIVTESKKELKETNRKGEQSKVEEIIKRYYMLDEQEQIQVLQQTFRKCKSENSISNTIHLQLLENEDLNNIEIPEVIVKKTLEFKDEKK